MQDLYIIPIEKLETRYTTEWYHHIPKMLEIEAQKIGKDVNVIVVDGEEVSPMPTPGAFLDFAATNIFKSSQLSAICDQFRQNKIAPNTKFLFTDAWNPNVIQLRYMSELLGIPIEIHGMWHAGSYDPADFLGRLIGDKPWVRNAEKSMMECYDTNWFATTFHMDMFIKTLFGKPNESIYEYAQTRSNFIGTNKVDITGWPMDYLFDTLKPFTELKKKPQIVFPHRLAPEKQLEIFKDLEKSMPEYQWIVCQEKTLTKDDYHTILGESKIIFSASLQETLGISSCIEGPLCGALPFSPNRLSYAELFKGFPMFLYPSEWTENWEAYIANKYKLIERLKLLIEYSNSTWIKTYLNEYINNNCKKYFIADNLIKSLIF